MDDIQNYLSDSDCDDKDVVKEDSLISFNTKSLLLESSFLKPINATPEIDIKDSLNYNILVNPHTNELICNPTYKQFAPLMGPINPYKTEKELAKKNTLTGFVQRTNLDEFNFENQRRTHQSFGYSESINGNPDVEKGKTVFESTAKRAGDKRKKLSNYDATDVENYTGPWAKFENEILVSVPSAEDKAYMEEYLAKKAKKHQKTVVADTEPVEDKTALHIENEKDYQGRSFMLPPLSVEGINFKCDTPPGKCFVPKKIVHQWTNAHRQGVSIVRLFPHTGHLMLTGGMDKYIRLWEVYNDRRLIRSYLGHREVIKDLAFNNDGSQFLSSSYDKFIKLWDTETGQCLSQFTNKHVANVVKFNPDNDKQHLFLAGCQNKKILCYDVRSGETVQLYERHLGAVNSITFFDGNKRFVSTSDDRSLRMWEWDIPVDYRVLADPSMHSMPSVNVSRNSKWLVCQSLDNQIVTYNLDAGFKKTKKVFRNQVAAGSACQIDFSPDMKYLISGDGEGKIFVWDFKTTKCVEQWPGHTKAATAAVWLPHETSKVITAGWDGHIKLWD